MLSKPSHLLAIAAGLFALLMPIHAAQRPVRRELLVSAAASLSGLAPQLSQAFHDAHPIDIRFNFAGSNTLARQIIEGARVDVFISADEAQMDMVENAGRLAERTRVDLLGNRLMVVRINSRTEDAGAFRPPLLAEPNVRRVAMGDPDAVPVGVYARRWLEDIGLWNAVAPKVVPLPSSRAVLEAVRQGRADVGIVYVTDTDRGAYTVPAGEGARIIYPAAAIVGAREQEARLFVAFLRGPIARRIFEAARFVHLPD